MDEARQNVTALEMEWTSGMAVLQATPVSTAVNAINRYNRTQILIDSPELERKRMTGAFDVRDPLSFARAVAKLFGATVKPAPSGEVHLGL
jgi:transmembrane sensor